MSAQIICLADRRPKSEDIPEIDWQTAVDVAIRDLVEIELMWGTPHALERLSECRAMLAAFISSQLLI